MIIEVDGEEFDANRNTAMFMRYAQLDILNGLIVDSGEDYLYISAENEAFPRIYDPLRHEGVRLSLIQGEFDPTMPPHCYVIASIGRLIVDAAEEIKDGTA